MSFGFDPGLLGFSLFDGNFALSSRFVLLRSSLASQLIFSGDRSSGLFGFALDVLDNSSNGRFGPGLFALTHEEVPLISVVSRPYP